MPPVSVASLPFLPLANNCPALTALALADSAFTVIATCWNAGTDSDPHVLTIVAAPDNKLAREDLDLAPWS